MGNLNTSGKLILNATALKTARIAPILTGSISGDVTIEAFVENQAYDYRFLSMPVQSKTLDQWSDDILMTGFLGTPYPSFNFNSVYFYDETLSGSRDARYDSATNVTNPVNMGVGVQAYIGAADLMIDVKGNIYSGIQNFPVTFTDDLTQNVSEDGWNLIGNPYPSSIDWDSPEWVKVNLDDAVYIYKGSTNAYQTYINGVGTNGGSSIIPSSQAFWVKATDTPTLIGNENVKTATDVSFIERKKRLDILRLRISNQQSNDDIVIRYDKEATSKFDAKWDAFKLKGYPSNPSITAIQDSTTYSILSLNSDSMSQVVYLQVEVPQTGAYTIYADEVPLNASCLTLEDLFTNRIENLRDSASYTFHFSDTTTVPRFKLTASKIVEIDLNLAKCFGDSSALLVSSSSLTPINFRWNSLLNNNSFNDSNFVKQQFKFLGNDQFQITAQKDGCASQILNLEISQPDSLTIQLTTSIDTGFSSGTAAAVAHGGTAPYQYQWSTNPTLNQSRIVRVSAGNYKIQVIDINNCMANQLFQIGGLSTLIEENDISSLRVFPNPVIENLNIRGTHSAVRFEITDATGRTIQSGILQSNEALIHLKDIKTGMYFLNLKDEGNNISIKFNKL